MTDSQSQVSDGAAAVFLNQDVLGLQVPVGDAGLAWEGHHKVSKVSQGQICFMRLGSFPQSQ